MYVRATLFSHLFACAATIASSQTIRLTFTGASEGTSVHLDSILVMDLTSGEDTTLHGVDTVLVLGLSTGITPLIDRGAGFAMHPSHPDPFAERTNFEVDMAEAGPLQLGVSDAWGRTLVTYSAELPAGTHRFVLDGGPASMLILWAQTNGQRRSIRAVSLGGAGQWRPTLRDAGRSGPRDAVKTSRALFAWMPGDDLRFIGYATRSPGIILGAAIADAPTADATYTFTLHHGVPCTDAPFVTDAASNTYRTVHIGAQCWMAENLRTTSYANGDTIPEVPIEGEWQELHTGGWCTYDNEAVNDPLYGKLYNWYTVADPRNACPAGWHVPVEAEWATALNELGGAAVAGSKLKSTSPLWCPGNTDATDESGFDGLPGGYRWDWGVYAEVGALGRWWTATGLDVPTARLAGLYCSIPLAGTATDAKAFGCSVRCVQDQ